MFVEEANIKSNTSREKTRIVIRSTTNNVDHLSTITNERTATRVADSGTARRQGFRHASTRYVRKGSSKMRHRWRGIRTRLMNSWVIAATSASPNSPHTRRATTPNTAIVKPSLKRNQSTGWLPCPCPVSREQAMDKLSDIVGRPTKTRYLCRRQ